MTQEELGTICGTTKQSIFKYETGVVTNIPLDRLEKIAEALDISPAFLMGWDNHKSEEKSPPAIPDLPSNAMPLDVSGLSSYNVIGSIAAGYGSEALEEYTGEVQTVPRSSLRGRQPDEFFVLKVRGSSMYPQFLEGDHVLVHKCDVVNSGAIAVVLYNGDEATLKKVQYGDGYIDLVPINPEYQTRRIAGNDLTKCRILGRAASLLRDFEL